MASFNLQKILSDYGMLLVLILLCVFYSVSTLTEQNPRGTDAAEQVYERVEDAFGPDANLLIVSKLNAEHQLFASRLRTILAEKGYTKLETAQGEPPAIRSAFEAFDSLGTGFDAIILPQDYATIISNIKRSVPSMSAAPVISPLPSLRLG